MASYDENAEVTGKYINAFIGSTGEVSSVFERKTREMFQETLGDIEPEGWYKVGGVAEAFEKIADEIGDQTIKTGGEAGARAVPIPDDASLQEAYEVLDGAQQDVFQNSDMKYPGGRYTQEIDGRSGRFGADKAFLLPEAWAKGVHTAMIEDYGPDDAILDFQEVEPEGDEAFAWEVTW